MGTNLIISKIPNSRNTLAVSSKPNRAVIPACPLPDETGAKPLEARPVSAVYGLHRPRLFICNERRDFLPPITYAATTYRGTEKSVWNNEKKGTIILAYV